MRVRGLVLALALCAGPAWAQTTTLRTGQLVISALPSKASETDCTWVDADGRLKRGTCVSSVAASVPSALLTLSGSPITGSGTLAIGLANQSANTVFQRAGSTGAPSFSSSLTLGGALSVQGNTTLGDAGSDTVTLTGAVASHLIPSASDTYDLGSSSRLWNQGWISQINSVVFAEATATLFGGWSIVGKDAGSLAADVVSAATTVTFGKTMTPGHWVLIRAHDTGGVAKAEYLLVGSLVSGTTYNVTRDLAGAHSTDPAWASGTPFLVLGANGDGRIELQAYTTPRISILNQGATYGAVTELVRLGYLDGMPGMAAGKVGIYIGDGTKYLSYFDGTLTVRGSLNADDITAGTLTGRTVRTAASGSRIEMTASPNALKWYSGSLELGSISPDGVNVTAPTTGYNNNYAYKFGGVTGDHQWGVYGNSPTGSNRLVMVSARFDGSANQAIATLSASNSGGLASVVATVAATTGTPSVVINAFGGSVGVDSSLVGIGTASPIAPLTVLVTTDKVVSFQSRSGVPEILSSNASGSASESLRIFAGAVILANGPTTEAVRVEGGYAQLTEITDPSNGAANTARLFARDNGSGKTQLAVRFASGATVVLATEP